ncbi:MAG: single-stranded-DNA-specific exonuclease RecJ [Rhodothalassiaceae bacterium]
MLAELSDAVLGVDRSVLGRRWQLRPALDRHVEALCQGVGLAEPLARVLVGRGIGPEAAAAYLTPQLKTALPDPLSLLDMAAAAERLADAVIAKEPVQLFADYDVDGATSAAVLARYLRGLGCPVEIHIPDRLTEGYGPTVAAMRGFAHAGKRLVVTLDCGTASFEALQAARAAGLQVMVLDHHKAQPTLPPAYALVNPNRLDEAADAPGGLAAVGIAFLAVIALRAVLRKRDALPAGAPDPLALLDLVALGTVCDMAALTGANRALVAQGLKVMARRGNAGIAALADVAGAHGPPSCYHLGFLLGPRINAGGRIGDAGLGAALLSCDDPAQAATLARQLDQLNRERQAVEQAVCEAAMAQLALQDRDGPIALVCGEGWHPGVVGIVAGRLKEQLGRPALVLAADGATAVGSGRSVAGVDLGAVILDALAHGVLIKGGGHAMAVGLTVARDRLDDLMAFLSERLAAPVAAAQAQQTLALDGLVSCGGCTVDLAEALEQGGPYGIGNPAPRFVVPDVSVRFARTVGNGHVKVSLAGRDGVQISAVAFRAADGPLGACLQAANGARVHVAGQVRLSHYGGSAKADFHIEDASPALAHTKMCP